MNIIQKAFHDKSSSFPINQTSKLYPYHGSSKQLFDKFLIIGFNAITILQDFIPHKNKLLQHKIEPIAKNAPLDPLVNSYSFQINHEPMILTELCSDYEKILLDNDMILKLIFPNKPIGYFFPVEYMKSSKRPDYPKPFSLVFNSNPSSNEGLKKSYNGIAYITYDQYTEQSGNTIIGSFVTPKIFIMLSEFPYYSCYLHLLQEISKMFKNVVDVPIEVTLYNLIKYTPSPISSSLCIKLPQNQKQIGDDDNKNNSTLYFPQLTGLPIIDINLQKIFYQMGVQNIIKLFLFSFLEKDILVFGSNLEYISLVIFTFHTLNYPLNDGNYYWLNATVSYNDLITENSIFVGQSYPTMLGVHSPYNPTYLQYTKMNDHFILDLDNNIFELNPGKDKDNDDARMTNNFFQFVKKAIKGNSSLQKIELYQLIRQLYMELETLCSKKPIRPLKFYEDINEVDIKTGEMLDYNGKAQELFYKFIVKIIALLYKNITLHSEMDSKTNKNDRNRLKETFYNEYSKDNESMKNEDEKAFFEQLSGTFKFSSFIEGFVKSHNDNGLYQIPFIFLDEFANLTKQQSTELDDVNFISMIKDTYKKKYRNAKSTSTSGFQLFRNSSKAIGHSLLKKNSSLVKSKEFGDVPSENDEIEISFPTFELLHNADTSLMQKLHNEIYTSNDTITCIWKDLSLLNIVQGFVVYPDTANKKASSHRNNHSDKNGLYKYRQPFLNQKLLMKYIHYLNDTDKIIIEQIMPWANVYLTNEIRDIRVSHIANVVERIYINSKRLQVKDLFIYNIVLIFALTIPLSNKHDLIELMFLFAEFLDMNVSARKYFKELLFVFEHLSHGTNEEFNNSLRICVGLVLNKLRVKGLVSSSALTKLINLLNESESEGAFYDTDDSVSIPISLGLTNNTYKKNKERNIEFYMEFVDKHPEWEGMIENFPDYPKIPNEPSKSKEGIPQIVGKFESKNGIKYNVVSYLHSPKSIFRDLSELRDKLLYNVNKVSGVRFTTEHLKYCCLCLIFYTKNSKYFKDCQHSLDSVLMRILVSVVEYEEKEKAEEKESNTKSQQ